MYFFFRSIFSGNAVLQLHADVFWCIISTDLS